MIARLSDGGPAGEGRRVGRPARAGTCRLRQVVRHHVGDLAEAAVPGVEVEARSNLRQHVVERVHYALQQTTAKQLLRTVLRKTPCYSATLSYFKRPKSSPVRP